MSSRAITVLTTVGLLVIILGSALAWNEYVHGDWTCAFSKCVRVKP